ncbi:MAG TPA: 5'-nucleotidase C-terminal domain-containing protein [Polyangiaceae bacterium]|nr:5'-nucleotidase C-terminal domain-containing protein [Polyangiaceae bacterium]
MRALPFFLLVVLGGCGPEFVEGPEPGTLVLVHTADLHSHLLPYTERIGAFDARRGLGVEGELAEVGGLARLATLLSEVRAGPVPTLWIDSGDLVEGTRSFLEHAGRLELELVSRLGLDAHVPGNHDLSDGAAALARYASSAEFPVLGSNALPSGEGERRAGFAPFALLRAGPFSVAVIGVLPRSGDGDSVSHRERDAAEAVQAAIDWVRGVSDVVVLATHVGVSADVDLVRNTTGADVVLGGHDHRVLEPPLWIEDCAGTLALARGCVPRKVPVVHSGAYGKYLGVLELRLDRASAVRGAAADVWDGLEVAAALYTPLTVTSAVEEAPWVLALLEEERRRELAALPLAFAPVPVERFASNGADSPLGNWVAGAVLRATSATLAVLNTSTLRADLPSGLVDEAALVRAVPFEDRIVEAWVTTEDLARLLERAGVTGDGGACESRVQIAGARLHVDCGARERSWLRDAEGRCLAGDCDAPRGWLHAIATTDYVLDARNGPLAAARPLGSVARGSLRAALGAHARRARVCDAEARAACTLLLEERLEARCAEPGLELECSPEARRARAVALCDTLPCLDALAGASSDGRISIASGG